MNLRKQEEVRLLNSHTKIQLNLRSVIPKRLLNLPNLTLHH